MKQYLDLIRNVRDNGQRQANRTGTDSIFLPGAMLQFDLRQGFPAVTTKKLFFDQTIGELIGFLRGYDNAAKFRELGCKFWDANANDPGKEGSPNAWLSNPNRKGEDDLGRIYGVQWRKWINQDRDDVEYIDQVQNVLTKLKTNPTDRRMIINAWRPDEFDQMALPPCHVMYQFIANVEKNELHLCMYQRSCDLFLGVPHNIASSSMMLTVVAALTGFKPATFTHFLADAHVYVNHLDQIDLQLSREPKQLPILAYTGPGSVEWNDENEIPLHPSGHEVVCASIFDELKPEHFNLLDYDPHPAIKADMAV